VQYCTVQYSTVQYSAIQYSSVQYSTVQYSTIQYSTVQCSTVQYSTVHIYTQTVRRTTQITTNWEENRPCPVFASCTLAFALQLRKKHGKTSVSASWHDENRIYRTEHSVGMRKCQIYFLEKFKRHFLCSVNLFENRAVNEIK